MDHLHKAAETLYTELTQQYATSDLILKCRSALSIIRSHPEEVQQLAHTQINSYPFKDIPSEWLQLYCEASLWMVYRKLHSLWNESKQQLVDETITEVVRLLDMAIIMTGASGRRDLITSVLQNLSDASMATTEHRAEPAPKRRRIDLNDMVVPSRKCYSNLMNMTTHPTIKFPTSVLENPSMDEFQEYLDVSNKNNNGLGSLPCIIKNSLREWPALSTRPWSNPEHLLDLSIGGRRIVPVEVGRSYTDEAWGQKLIPLKDFMEENLFSSHMPPEKRGYLAQHDLLSQIPALGNDILIPDYCYTAPPVQYGLTGNGDIDEEQAKEDREAQILDGPSINAWLGPMHTITPAHTDPHANILAQVVGHKYIRLYAPTQSHRMYPRGRENGINMSNTSRIDVGLSMRLVEGVTCWREFDENQKEILAMSRTEFETSFPEFHKARYIEAILEPGDCLFIPARWWHYVHSLSTSFSVSFWWN